MSEDLCKICSKDAPSTAGETDEILWVSCDDCKGWFHIICLKQDKAWLEELGDNPYFCSTCLTAREVSDEEDQGQENERHSTQPIDANTEEAAGTGAPLADRGNNSQEQLQPVQEDHEDTVAAANIPKGHALVKGVVNHDFTNIRGRQFEVEYEDGSKLWHWEIDLRRCIGKIDAYCESKKEAKSKFKQLGKMGATLNLRENKSNWISMGETLRLTRVFGQKNGLQPKRFKELEPNDAIYIHQLGEHAFVFFWIASSKICYVADGLNTYKEDKEVQADINPLLSKAQSIRALTFNGQRFADHCAITAAALALEFQRLYKHDCQDIRGEIEVPPSILDRMAKIAHKEDSERVREWKPINEISFKISCPTCGAKLKGKNRAALNFHKCPTKAD